MVINKEVKFEKLSNREKIILEDARKELKRGESISLEDFEKSLIR